jgi:hypothetical protein
MARMTRVSPPKAVGEISTDQSTGKGNTCPNCSNLTLHRVKTLSNGQRIRRCRLCDYSGIEAAAS